MPISNSYHADVSSVSKTMLSFFADSHEDFYHYFVKRDLRPLRDLSRSKEVTVGQCVHEVMLTDKDIDEVIVCYPDDCFKSNGHLNPHKANPFFDQHAGTGVMVMRPKDYEKVVDICDAIDDHDLGKVIRETSDAKREVPVYWDDPRTGLKCRCCPDWMVELEDRILCYDLKITSSIYPRPFERISRRLKYWMQDAHYSAGLEAVYGKPVEFKFWAVEALRPHRISPREYSPTSKDISRDAYYQLMEQLKRCYDTNDWRDDWTKSVSFMEVSPWDIDSQDDKLEGFDE